MKKVYLKQLAVRYKTTLIERKYLKEKVGKQYRLHIGKVCVHEVKSIALNNACNENVKPLIPLFSEDVIEDVNSFNNACNKKRQTLDPARQNIAHLFHM